MGEMINISQWKRTAYREAMLAEFEANCDAHEAATVAEVRERLPIAWRTTEEAGKAFQAYLISLPPKSEEVAIEIGLVAAEMEDDLNVID